MVRFCFCLSIFYSYAAKMESPGLTDLEEDSSFCVHGDELCKPTVQVSPDYSSPRSSLSSLNYWSTTILNKTPSPEGKTRGCA